MLQEFELDALCVGLIEADGEAVPLCEGDADEDGDTESEGDDVALKVAV